MSESSENGRKENMKIICVMWTLIFVSCMAVMLAFAAGKTIVIADTAREQTGLSENPEHQEAALEEKDLRLRRTYGVTDSICVPLPKGIKAEDVMMENRYQNMELWLYIRGADEAFYEGNAIDGDISPILSGQSIEQAEGVLLKMQMEHVLEYKSTMDGNILTVSWCNPHELYEYVVVLDAAGGGKETGVGDTLQEKDLTLQVARLAQQKLMSENVRLYLTRTDDREVSAANRVGLAQEVQADLYIRLSASVEENTELYGITGIYNEEYFIPYFGNVNLADIVTREVTIASGNRAIGLETAEKESILRSLDMPAAEVSLGYLSNAKELYLLGQEAYRNKLAEGVVNAVSKAVESLKTMEEK